MVSDPVTSPVAFAVPPTISPIGLAVAATTAAGKTMPGSLPPPDLISPRPSGRSPCAVIW